MKSKYKSLKEWGEAEPRAYAYANKHGWLIHCDGKHLMKKLNYF